MDDLLTIEEVAAMHNMDPHSIRRIIWTDKDRPDAEKRLPGAYKIGSKQRGTWLIPRRTAESFKPDTRGRR